MQEFTPYKEKGAKFNLYMKLRTQIDSITTIQQNRLENGNSFPFSYRSLTKVTVELSDK